MDVLSWTSGWCLTLSRDTQNSGGFLPSISMNGINIHRSAKARLGFIRGSSAHVWFSLRTSSPHGCCHLMNQDPAPAPGALQGEHPLLPTRNLVFTVTAIKEPRFYSSVAFPLYLDKIPAPCPRGCTAPGPEPRWLPWLSGRSPLMRRGSGCISTQFPPSSFPAPGPGILTTPPTVPIANLFSFTATFDVHSTRVGRPFPVSLPGRRANPTKVLGIRAPQGPLLRPPLPHCGCQTSLSPPALLLAVTHQPRC